MSERCTGTCIFKDDACMLNPYMRRCKNCGDTIFAHNIFSRFAFWLYCRFGYGRYEP